MVLQASLAHLAIKQTVKNATGPKNADSRVKRYKALTRTAVADLLLLYKRHVQKTVSAGEPQHIRCEKEKATHPCTEGRPWSQQPRDALRSLSAPQEPFLAQKTPFAVTFT